MLGIKGKHTKKEKIKTSTIKAADSLNFSFKFKKYPYYQEICLFLDYETGYYSNLTCYLFNSRSTDGAVSAPGNASKNSLGVKPNKLATMLFGNNLIYVL
jgi:hypothetical protein